MVAVGQKVRPKVTQFTSRSIERRRRNGRAAAGGNLEKRVPSADDAEQDVAVLIPGAALQRLSAGDIGDSARWSAGNVDSLQFGLQPVDKRDRPAVGRPE